MLYKRAAFLTILTCFIFTACHERKNENKTVAYNVDLEKIEQRDTLRVGVMFGPVSYFLYRDDYMGYDYEMAENLADSLGVNIKFYEAKSELELEHKLQDRTIDLIASNIYETNELKKLFWFVFPQNDSYQVLVQRMNADRINDVTELKGKKIYVKPNTILESRLISLNKELGESFEIAEAPDSLSSEDLIEMVAADKIDYTTAYYKTASLYKYYYKRLDVRMPIGFDQRNGWLIRHESKKLKKAIEQWQKSKYTKDLEEDLDYKYRTRNLYFSQKKIRIPKGAISPYDYIFKKYASEIGWDWRLLAAVAYQESHFDSAQISWAGAAGIMQLMPRTASNFGLTRKTIFNPEKNIEAGVQYIKSLNMSFQKVTNKEERIKFILAAYNSGPAHIIDAMSLTQKYGRNTQIWYNNVEYFLLKKSEPQFYNDPVVKYGSFRGKETVSYVINTLDTYESYLRKK